MAIIEVREALENDMEIEARYDGNAEVIKIALKHSETAWTALIDGEIMAVWGFFMPTMTEPVLIWAATTRVVERNKIAFYRIFRQFITELVREFGPVRGVLTPGAPSKWLERAGFEIMPPNEDGLREFRRWH